MQSQVIWDQARYAIDTFSPIDGESGHDVMARLPIRHVPALYDPKSEKYSARFGSIAAAMMEVTLPGDFAEFGVYKGVCARYITSFVRKNRKLHLFDSFEGLPEDWRPGMKKGHFNLNGKIPKFDPKRTVVHQGWFSSTVPQFAKELTQPLAFLHLDADLYSSTMDVLLGLNGFIVPGTIFDFDEYVFDDTEEEHRALVDWAKQCGRRFEYLWRSEYIQVAVKVVE